MRRSNAVIRHKSLEQYCESGFTGTDNGPVFGGENTVGGYSDPAQLAAGAPLLCTGVVTFSPLRRWGVQPGHKVGIVGLGGLGHLALKIAAAMGAQVVLFGLSPGRLDKADGSGPHDLRPFIALLQRDRTMTLVGAPAEPHPSPEVFSLIFKRRRLAGSLIGGIAQTQEMLDFCAEHDIVSDIEMIPMSAINEAYERMLKGDLNYRFVIDMTTLPQAEPEVLAEAA